MKIGTMENKEVLRIDFLKEVSNIGLGHAASSLSTMINARVEISLPTLSMISIQNIIGIKNEDLCAVKTGFEGDIKGALIIVFKDSTSFWLIDKISGNKPGFTKNYEGLGLSAITEFTNIIGGSFLTALANFTNYRLFPKIPEPFTGKGFEIKEQFYNSLQKDTRNAFYVKTEIYVEKKKVEGEIYLILDKDSFDLMFKKMSEN
jgi:chemotaxis protein CheC